MKIVFLPALLLLIAANASAQQFEPVQPTVKAHPAEPAGKENGALLSIPLAVAGEAGATVRDLATFRDIQSQILTVAQIAAASADAQTSIYNLAHCPSCREIGISKWVVGIHPDAHKYIVAGVVEIAIEAVAAHYLRHHGPVQKWYWRSVWTLPQSISLYGHTSSTLRNISPRTRCDPQGQNCF